MNKWQKINLLCFSILALITAGLIYALGTMSFTAPLGKPWHLLPSVHEDSLSQEYLERYRILDKKALRLQLYDSSRVNVFILVDAWGVPNQESVLKEEFAYFEKIPHTYALHQRLGARNKHAERVEFRDGPENKMYLFGGDSLEFNRPKLVGEIGFNKTLFCQNCGDEKMVAQIDSLLENDSLQWITWTTQSSRGGDKDSLRKSLKLIADLALRHPDVQFVVQGSHRPVLCSPEIRNSYKYHWVPVVVLNEKNEKFI